MVNSQDFSKRLQMILDFYSLSATSFSEKVAVNRSTISHLLSGRNKPSLEFVMKILSNFPEVELYWLLNGKGTFPLQVKSENSENQNLINEELSNISIPSVNLEEKASDSEIDKIVIFYKDGTFKAYKNY
ncbi:MAG: transcriptional regulator with XRE-family HTH domain [Flavobacteriaceae bacterium]|uniref:helix-turn-helix domain-containing protein n=1 Tax=Candidatus Marifrigoribacter sp. Uisw_064 TaxID=3230970 RepID=UPI003AEE5B7C